jgi:hypothetical protein
VVVIHNERHGLFSASCVLDEPASPSPVIAQTNNAAPQVTPGNAQQNAPNTTIANSPLRDSDVLPLLHATSALSVSTQPNGMTAYVTVPGTPAKGMADPNSTLVGRMADGRLVGIVPLDSGGSAGIAYALMWVWTDGRAQFVGEIPAENGGLGQLNVAVRDGVIDLSWPVSATATREKVLTLDGIRLRPLSDQIVARH